MVLLNKIKYNNKLFQVIIDDNQNRVILEIKKDQDSNSYYMYPEFNDLLAISKKYFVMSSEVYENNKKNSSDKKTGKKKTFKDRFIRIAQKVIIMGVVVMVVLTLPVSVKNYVLDKTQDIYDVAIEIAPHTITSIEELNQVFNAESITIEDVHKAIDDNPNLEEYKEIIHEYADDVHNKRSEHNWWIFYQNIKKMNIETSSPDEMQHKANGYFNITTGKITLNSEIADDELKHTLNHELTHASSLICDIIDGYFVDISFHPFISDYGMSVMEVLTEIANSHFGEFVETSYSSEQVLYEPIIDMIGKEKIIDELYNGDINSFIKLCEPYYSNIYEYIAYVDAYTRCVSRKTTWKDEIDKDFVINFNKTSLEFYLNLKYHQLKENKISYQNYIQNKDGYVRTLHHIIDKLAHEGGIELNLTIPDEFKLIDTLEKEIFDKETLTQWQIDYDNQESNLIWEFKYNDDGVTFDNVYIDRVNENGLLEPHYANTSYSIDGIDNLYFLVEITKYDNKPKLRLINKKDSRYLSVDLLTFQYIDENANIISEVPLSDYMNSIPPETLQENNNYPGNYYYLKLYHDFFNVEDIINFANKSNTRK